MKTNDAAAVGRIVVIPVSCVDDVVVVTASPDDAKKGVRTTLFVFVEYSVVHSNRFAAISNMLHILSPVSPVFFNVPFPPVLR